MKLILAPHDEKVKYEVEIENEGMFIQILKDTELGLTKRKVPMHILSHWYKMLTHNVIILSPKYLNTSIRHVKAAKTKTKTKANLAT